MNPYIGPWRNGEQRFSSAMYIQICRPEELQSWDQKLYDLIIKYGSSFDSIWEYWINKRETWIRRTPLGYGKRIPTEKPRKYEPNRKLMEC